MAREALPEDEALLREALRRETVSWVRRALRTAIDRAAGGRSSSESAIASDLEDDAIDDVYAEAMEETTGRIIHEISPIVGAVQLYAELETDKYEASRLRRQVDRLQAMLEALNGLSRAAAAPRLTEFDLALCIEDVLLEVRLIDQPRIDAVGSDALVAVGDPTLVGMIVRIGLRNAVEATFATAEDPAPPIVVRWDETDIDYWVAVLDRGIGLPPTAGQIFEMGVTGKRGHLGMGLSLARRAAQSLRGAISITPRAEGGVQFRLRWPKPEASQ
jgi:signal transduction histidine kinase